MQDRDQAIKSFAHTVVADDLPDSKFYDQYISDLHSMIDSQVKTALISFVHVFLYKIRNKQSDWKNLPIDILKEMEKFCVSLTLAESTSQFNQILLEFIGGSEDVDRASESRGSIEESTNEASH